MPVDFDKLVNKPLSRIFGQTVAYTPPSGGDPVSASGVWWKAHQTVETDGESNFSSTAPTLGIRLSEWPVAPIQYGQVEVDGQSYKIEEVQPDGEGGAKLILKET